MSIGVMLFNPFNGRPRRPEDIKSDPYGILIWDGVEPMKTAPTRSHVALNVRHPDCHKAADAFWDYWRANGETHKHGYYESTWGAINRALIVVGVTEWKPPQGASK